MHERERVKLARSLHDGIAQDLVGLSYRLQALLADEDTPLKMRAQIRESIFGIDQLSSKVRDEIFALRNTPSTITIAELHTNLLNATDEILILLDSAIDPETLIPWQLLEVCQELVRNARTHAGATRIEITLTLLNNLFTCVVGDDGTGEISIRAGHYGLIGIQELLFEIGGQISIEQEGSRLITLTFPHIHS